MGEYRTGHFTPAPHVFLLSATRLYQVPEKHTLRETIPDGSVPQTLQQATELWDVLDVEMALRIADSQLLPLLDVTC